MKEIMTALSNTPTWVYLLFAYLIWVGVKASRQRVIKIKKLLILPIIFTYLSVHSLLVSFQVQVFEVSVWSASILLGAILGWFTVYRTHQQIRVDKEKYLIQIPGTWVTLILILLIFMSKYYFSYQLAVDPELSSQTGFEFSMLAVSGAITGMLIGRVLCYLYKYNTLGHTTLVETD